MDDLLPFPGVEAGWRLARSAWGHGYATESAIAVLAYGFTTVDLSEILAITTARNLRSQAVMQRIGMTTDQRTTSTTLTSRTAHCAGRSSIGSYATLISRT